MSPETAVAIVFFAMACCHAGVSVWRWSDMDATDRHGAVVMSLLLFLIALGWQILASGLGG